MSRFALGAMSFGVLGNTDHDDCVRIVHAALDAGVNLIDTADVYSGGESEVIVGKALAGRRDDVVLSSKCFWPMGADPNQPRRVAAVDRACRRGQPAPARHRPARRLLPAQARPGHRPRGVARRARATSCTRARCSPSASPRSPARGSPRAQWVASSARASSDHRVEQPPYSIFSRSVERDVLPTCERFGMGSLVWGPLDSGWLTGKYRASAAPDGSRAARWERTSVAVRPVARARTAQARARRGTHTRRR